MSHGYHERGEDGRPFLCDGCERCEEQAGQVGVLLDEPTWQKAWKLMLAVEYGDDESYASEAEAKLCGELYLVSLVLNRYAGVNPHNLIERS